MDDTELHARLEQLDRRTHRLGRANRRMRIMVAGCLAVALGAIAVAGLRQAPAPHTDSATANDEVTARVLTMVDGKGQARIRLGTAEGSTGVFVLDGRGKSRASLTAADDGEPSLLLSDKTGSPRITLTTTPEGMAAVTLFGHDETPQLVLNTKASGEPRIAICDTKGAVRGLLTLLPEDKMLLSMSDGSGRPRVSVAAGSQGHTVANLFGNTDKFGCGISVLPDDTIILGLGSGLVGMPGILLSTSPDKTAAFALRGSEGNSRVRVYTTADGETGIEVWDKERRPRAVMKVAVDGTPTMATQPKTVAPRE